jgi:hypothetical protein
VTGETEIPEENLLQCPGRRGAKSATNRLSYDTANIRIGKSKRLLNDEKHSTDGGNMKYVQTFDWEGPDFEDQEHELQ